MPGKWSTADLPFSNQNYSAEPNSKPGFDSNVVLRRAFVELNSWNCRGAAHELGLNALCLCESYCYFWSFQRIEMTSCFNVVRNKQHNWGKTIRSYKIYGNRLLISPFSNTQSCKVSCLKLVTRAALITKHKVRHETRVYSSYLAQFGLFLLPEKYAVKEVDFFSHHFATWKFSKWTLRESRRLFKVKNRVYNQKALRQNYFQILLHFNFWVCEQNQLKSVKIGHSNEYI